MKTMFTSNQNTGNSKSERSVFLQTCLSEKRVWQWFYKWMQGGKKINQ